MTVASSPWGVLGPPRYAHRRRLDGRLEVEILADSKESLSLVIVELPTLRRARCAVSPESLI